MATKIPWLLLTLTDIPWYGLPVSKALEKSCKWLLFCSLILKVNKSAYIAKSRQQYHKILKKFCCTGKNHALKDMFMLNYETIKVNSFYYCSIEVLIDFINSAIAIHNFFKKATLLFTSASSTYDRKNF